MMREAQTIGEKLGIQFRVSIEKRIAGAEAVGEHKTSMLQDVEAGRPLEIDALVGSVIELGRLTARRRRTSRPCTRWTSCWPRHCRTRRPACKIEPSRVARA